MDDGAVKLGLCLPSYLTTGPLLCPSPRVLRVLFGAPASLVVVVVVWSNRCVGVFIVVLRGFFLGWGPGVCQKRLFDCVIFWRTGLPRWPMYCPRWRAHCP